ncbi:hypothetical protein I4U23_002586 [Adineta vaga]|nr:hypothetical protein I4U23_002586 [Adineta vaga]
MTTTYENIFFEVFNCFPNESKPLEEYSKDELIRLIKNLQKGIETLNTSEQKPEQIVPSENEDYGFGIIAENQEDLESFQEFCSKNFLPISKENCHVSSVCNQDMINHYQSTGINHLRSEYAMFIILKNVRYSQSLSFIDEKQFSLNNKVYIYQLKILLQDTNETNEEFLKKIRQQLLGEIFVIDRNDHESIPSLPSPKEPQFVAILPYTQIACGFTTST